MNRVQYIGGVCSVVMFWYDGVIFNNIDLFLSCMSVAVAVLLFYCVHVRVWKKILQ